MSTLFLSKPNENLSGARVRGLTKHDDIKAEQIKDTWYRANNLDKIKAREKKLQLASDRGNGPFTAISDWLMVTGEIVRDKASWRKATVVKIDDDNNKRTIRYADNNSELKLEVYQLEIFAQNNDVALVFRDWFQTRTPRLIELPPIRQQGEETLCSVLNSVWTEECELAPSREISPIEIAFISQRLMLGTIDGVLREAGIDLDAPNSVTHKQFAFEIAGHSELPRKLSTLAPLPKGGEMRTMLPANKPKDEVTPWGVANLTCVPLWWDANSTTLRSLQSIFRHRYYPHYAHWSDAQLLGTNNGIKEEDEAAVLVLITMDRLGPPVIRENNDRSLGLRFDVPAATMTTLLQATDLVKLPMGEPMHLHSPGFSWPCSDRNDAADDDDDGYYRQAERQSHKVVAPEVVARERLLMECCVEQPVVRWQREITAASTRKEKQASNIEEIAPGYTNAKRTNYSYSGERSGHDDAVSVATSFNMNSIQSEASNSFDGGSSSRLTPYQSVRDSLLDSRVLESELAGEGDMTNYSGQHDRNFLMTSVDESGTSYSLNGNNTWGGASGNKAALERKEADKYSVVLNNTTNNYANASLWSESFKEKSARPLNHHVLTEAPTTYHPSQSMSEYDDLNESSTQTAKSVRPRNMTPRSSTRMSNNNLDTPGQQARLAASKFKTTNYGVNGKPNSNRRASASSSMFESPSKIKSSGRNKTSPDTTSTSKHKVSAREAEETGHRLAYRATAAKWAGPIAGKEKGYGNYEIRSTTRRVIDGPLPTEQHGKWERPSIHDDDFEFHASPPPRARWETKALRLANAYDVPEKPTPYPLFRVGEKVRAQSFDQPHAWFDAQVVTVLPDLTGDPAATKYNVRYEGYKQQPPGTSLGKNLPVEMIKGASSMLGVER